jgi:hypothetical protein
MFDNFEEYMIFEDGYLNIFEANDDSDFAFTYNSSDKELKVNIIELRRAMYKNGWNITSATLIKNNMYDIKITETIYSEAVDKQGNKLAHYKTSISPKESPGEVIKLKEKGKDAVIRLTVDPINRPDNPFSKCFYGYAKINSWLAKLQNVNKNEVFDIIFLEDITVEVDGEIKVDKKDKYELTDDRYYSFVDMAMLKLYKKSIADINYNVVKMLLMYVKSGGVAFADIVEDDMKKLKFDAEDIMSEVDESMRKYNDTSIKDQPDANKERYPNVTHDPRRGEKGHGYNRNFVTNTNAREAAEHAVRSELRHDGIDPASIDKDLMDKLVEYAISNGEKNKEIESNPIFKDIDFKSFIRRADKILIKDREGVVNVISHNPGQAFKHDKLRGEAGIEDTSAVGNRTKASHTYEKTFKLFSEYLKSKYGVDVFRKMNPEVVKGAVKYIANNGHKTFAAAKDEFNSETGLNLDDIAKKIASDFHKDDHINIVSTTKLKSGDVMDELSAFDIKKSASKFGLMLDNIEVLDYDVKYDLESEEKYGLIYYKVISHPNASGKISKIQYSQLYYALDKEHRDKMIHGLSKLLVDKSKEDSYSRIGNKGDMSRYERDMKGKIEGIVYNSGIINAKLIENIVDIIMKLLKKEAKINVANLYGDTNRFDMYIYSNLPHKYVEIDSSIKKVMLSMTVSLVKSNKEKPTKDAIEGLVNDMFSGYARYATYVFKDDKLEVLFTPGPDIVLRDKSENISHNDPDEEYQGAPKDSNERMNSQKEKKFIDNTISIANEILEYSDTATNFLNETEKKFLARLINDAKEAKEGSTSKYYACKTLSNKIGEIKNKYVSHWKYIIRNRVKAVPDSDVDVPISGSRQGSTSSAHRISKEIKKEYRTHDPIADEIKSMYKKFPTGTFAAAGNSGWSPVETEDSKLAPGDTPSVSVSSHELDDMVSLLKSMIGSSDAAKKEQVFNTVRKNLINYIKSGEIELGGMEVVKISDTDTVDAKLKKLINFMSSIKQYTSESLLEGSIPMFDQFIEESKLSDAEPEKGKMHELLGLDPKEKITSKYSSGEKLASDLLKANYGDKRKTSSMLAFAANIHKGEDIFDKALSSLKKKDKTNESSNPVMMFEEFIEQEKNNKKEFDKIHKLLGMKDNETVVSKYTSGAQLAVDLVNANNGDAKKVMTLLSAALKASKGLDHELFDIAFRSLENAPK